MPAKQTESNRKIVRLAHSTDALSSEGKSRKLVEIIQAVGILSDHFDCPPLAVAEIPYLWVIHWSVYRTGTCDKVLENARLVLAQHKIFVDELGVSFPEYKLPEITIP